MWRVALDASGILIASRSGGNPEAIDRDLKKMCGEKKHSLKTVSEKEHNVLIAARDKARGVEPPRDLHAEIDDLHAEIDDLKRQIAELRK